MKIVVAVKVVPDDQDIFVSPDRSLDYSKAKPKISEYDKNALEAAAQFAAANDGSQVIAISAVPAKNDDTKAKQNILALGVDELFMATDDALETADSYATAQVLKNIVETKVPDYDVIICGDGSADLYAGQVNIQLAAALGVPTINEVTSLTAEGDKLVVERTLDEEVEAQLLASLACATSWLRRRSRKPLRLLLFRSTSRSTSRRSRLLNLLRVRIRSSKRATSTHSSLLLPKHSNNLEKAV